MAVNGFQPDEDLMRRVGEVCAACANPGRIRPRPPQGFTALVSAALSPPFDPDGHRPRSRSPVELRRRRRHADRDLRIHLAFLADEHHGCQRTDLNGDGDRTDPSPWRSIGDAHGDELGVAARLGGSVTST